MDTRDWSMQKICDLATPFKMGDGENPSVIITSHCMQSDQSNNTKEDLPLQTHNTTRQAFSLTVSDAF